MALEIDDLLKEYGIGPEKGTEAANTTKLELVDPATGEKREFKDIAELQNAVTTMYNSGKTTAEQYAAELAALKNKGAETKKPTKDKKEDQDEVLAEFTRLSEKSPIEGLNFLMSKTKFASDLNQKVEEVTKVNQQTETATRVAAFTAKHKEFLVEHPKAQEIGTYLSQLLLAQGIQNPTEAQMEIALNAGKSLKPDLFKVAERVEVPPYPGRSGGDFSPNDADLQRKLEALYAKDPAAAKRFLDDIHRN